MKYLISIIFFAAIALSTAACAEKSRVDDSKPSIGSAKMLANGTIALMLRAETSANVGDAYFEIKPSDPTYAETLTHVGGLHPEEEKPVPPWPEVKK